jgi:hypothetical protein
MRRILMTLLIGAALAAASGAAVARDHVSFGVTVGAPVYAYPPAPVYYGPPPYYGPGYYRPAYYGPAFYGPAWGVRFHEGYRGGWHHRH